MYFQSKDKDVRIKIVEYLAVLMIKSKESINMNVSEMKSTEQFSQVFFNLLNHEMRGSCLIPIDGDLSLNVD